MARRQPIGALALGDPFFQCSRNKCFEIKVKNVFRFKLYEVSDFYVFSFPKPLCAPLNACSEKRTTSALVAHDSL